jgi:hypothetical protein
MNDDELLDRLRAHADELEAVRSGTIGRMLTDARARSGDASVKRRKPALLGAAIALATVVVVGGAVWRYAAQRRTIHVSASDPATSLPGQGAAVTARIELPDTIVGGSQVEAALVIDNNTGASITIPGCGPSWAIALTNASHASDIAFALPCREALVVQTGQTKFPTVVTATFAVCSNGTSNDDTTPKCLADTSPPPLPPGDYTAILVGLGKDPLPGIPNPSPVTVHLVAAP